MLPVLVVDALLPTAGDPAAARVELAGRALGETRHVAPDLPADWRSGWSPACRPRLPTLASGRPRPPNTTSASSASHQQVQRRRGRLHRSRSYSRRRVVATAVAPPAPHDTPRQAAAGRSRKITVPAAMSPDRHGGRVVAPSDPVWFGVVRRPALSTQAVNSSSGSLPFMDVEDLATAGQRRKPHRERSTGVRPAR